MRKRVSSFVSGGIILMIILGNPAQADPSHYKEILVGDRAAGLGGSFTAISDDATGAYYNPAGLILVPPIR